MIGKLARILVSRRNVWVVRILIVAGLYGIYQTFQEKLREKNLEQSKLQRVRKEINAKMSVSLPAYDATCSVPLTCDSCVQDVSRALQSLPGIKGTKFSVADKLVTVTSTEPPSRIVKAIQSTGRAAVLRGSGRSNSAAVCILETPVDHGPYNLPAASRNATPSASPVRGLARLIELGDRITMLDLTLTGMGPGVYAASVRKTGDISRGKESLGETFSGLEGQNSGHFGEIKVDSTGRGSIVAEIQWPVWEMVGRGMLLERVGDYSSTNGLTNGTIDGTKSVSQRDRNGVTTSNESDDDVVMGVIARSAGVWENDKVVCGCSGKTVWEERAEMVEKGIS